MMFSQESLNWLSSGVFESTMRFYKRVQLSQLNSIRNPEQPWNLSFDLQLLTVCSKEVSFWISYDSLTFTLKSLVVWLVCFAALNSITKLFKSVFSGQWGKLLQRTLEVCDLRFPNVLSPKESSRPQGLHFTGVHIMICPKKGLKAFKEFWQSCCQ